VVYCLFAKFYKNMLDLNSSPHLQTTPLLVFKQLLSLFLNNFCPCLQTILLLVFESACFRITALLVFELLSSFSNNSSPRLQTTPHRFCSIMFYFLLALLLLPITYDKCNTSLTSPLEFTCLSNANCIFVSTQLPSHMTSSWAYSPVHRYQKTIPLNHSFIGPTTESSFLGPTTQRSFIGPMTQHHHNKTGPMTQISGGTETFVYQSRYNFVTPQHALVRSFSHFECQHNQFPGKREIQIFNHSQIETIFCLISSADTPYFLRWISTKFLCRLKMRLTLSDDWNINHKIYIFMLSSHDVDLLIACILMKLQRYTTRRHDFAGYWRLLLFHCLLKSQHMFFWVLIVLFKPLCIFCINLFIFFLNLIIFLINLIIFLINQVIFLMNLIIFLYILIIKLLVYLYIMIQNLFIRLWKLYVVILRNKIKIVLHISLLLMSFCEWAYFMTFYMPKPFVFAASNVEIEHTFIGGGSSTRSDFKMLEPYIISTNIQVQNPEEFNYVYDGHGSFNKVVQKFQACGENYIICNIPLSSIVSILTMTQTNEVAKEHNLHALSRKSLAEKRTAIKSHICTKVCNERVTLFKAVEKSQKARQRQNKEKVKKVVSQPKVGRKYWTKSKQAIANHKYYIKNNAQFPPSPPSNCLMHKIISGFCDDTHPTKFEEAGCTVCGQLVVKSKLIKLTDIKCSMDPLVRVGVTRLARKSVDDPIEEIQGPIIDTNCKHACQECISYLEKKLTPPTALANGLWVGDVPKELSDLTFVERLLVARVRSNRCIVHVLKGGWKMRANAIMFPTPIPKVCNILPPPIDELDEVIAFMFPGIARPTLEDTKRTPMLARRQYISAALEWLKINHSDYADVQISQENLKLYPEEGPPVIIDYRSSIINKHKEATSIFDMEEEEGVHNGDCPFVVHGTWC